MHSRRADAVILARFGTALLLAGWWGLLTWVIHACFLRPPPRSLELTLVALLDRPRPALVLIAALGAGSGIRIVLANHSPLDALAIIAAGVWLALLLA